MHIVEYGTTHPDIVLMLHGGGLGWWNFETAALVLQNRFHVVIPSLDGHAGSSDPFTTIEDNASRILAYVDSNYSGRILCLYGLSLGAQIALEMLSMRPSLCSVAFLESAMVIPSPVTHRLIGPSVRMSYPLISKPWFAKLQFRQLRIRSDLYPDYFRDSCLISPESMVSFLEANTAYSAKETLASCTAEVELITGSRENAAMQRSQQKLEALFPKCRRRIIPGLYHGQYSINHGKECAESICAALKRFE